MRYLFCIPLVALSFYAGTLVNKHRAESSSERKKVTGIGGIFFKCKDPKSLKEWYSKNLGLNTDKYGTVFQYYQGADSTKKGFLQWSPFRETTTYFAPSVKEFMINYRVENMDVLVAELRAAGVNITDTIQRFDYGNFVHIMDPEGNKIELWEANDHVYSQITGGLTK